MDPFRGERIAKLKQHPAWEDLVAEVEEQESDHWDGIARKLKSAANVVDLEDIALKREFYRGMRDVLLMPDRGAKAIEKHVEKGEVTTA